MLKTSLLPKFANVIVSVIKKQDLKLKLCLLFFPPVHTFCQRKRCIRYSPLEIFASFQPPQLYPNVHQLSTITQVFSTVRRKCSRTARRTDAAAWTRHGWSRRRIDGSPGTSTRSAWSCMRSFSERCPSRKERISEVRPICRRVVSYFIQVEGSLGRVQQCKHGV